MVSIISTWSCPSAPHASAHNVFVTESLPLAPAPLGTQKDPTADRLRRHAPAHMAVTLITDENDPALPSDAERTSAAVAATTSEAASAA